MKGIIEGLLYVQGDLGLTINQVADILEITNEEAKQLILSLKQDYIEQDRGLRINYLGNSFKLTTKEEHKEYFRKLLENPKNNTLSNAALETLAIIAYNQPITRAEVAQLVNLYLLRAPADVDSKTKTGFTDVSRKHKLFADIVEATREAHTYYITDETTEEAEF